MNETTITKKLVRLGNGLAVIIPNDIIEAMQLNQGTLLELKIKNTGKEILPRKNKKKEETQEIPVKEEPTLEPMDVEV